MAVSILFKKIGKEGVSVVEFTLFRNVFNLTGASLMCLFFRNIPWKDLPKANRSTMAVRSFIGQLCFACFTFCLQLIPLSLQMILFQTSPFWAGILGFFINKEPIYRFEYFAMLLCFLGVMGIAFSKPTEVDDDGVAIVIDNNNRLYGIALIIFTAWLFAGCGVINRFLKNLHFSTVLFFHGAFGLILITTYILMEHWITGDPFRTYTGAQYGWLLLCCCFDFLSVNCQTVAY